MTKEQLQSILFSFHTHAELLDPNTVCYTTDNLCNILVNVLLRINMEKKTDEDILNTVFQLILELQQENTKDRPREDTTTLQDRGL